MDKRGSSDTENIIFPVVIAIIINLAFFSAVILFVNNASTGAMVYEQAHAKQLALFIDAAKPGTEIKIDFSKIFEIADKNKKAREYTVKIIPENKILVSAGKGGFAQPYFSDSKIVTKVGGNFLVLDIGEKNG